MKPLIANRYLASLLALLGTWALGHLGTVSAEDPFTNYVAVVVGSASTNSTIVVPAETTRPRKKFTIYPTNICHYAKGEAATTNKPTVAANQVWNEEGDSVYQGILTLRRQDSTNGSAAMIWIEY